MAVPKGVAPKGPRERAQSAGSANGDTLEHVVVNHQGKLLKLGTDYAYGVMHR